MMKLNCLGLFLATSAVSTPFVAGETADEYHTRLGNLLNDAFVNQNNPLRGGWAFRIPHMEIITGYMETHLTPMRRFLLTRLRQLTIISTLDRFPRHSVQL